MCMQIALIHEALMIRLGTISMILEERKGAELLHAFELAFNDWAAVFLFYSDQKQKYFARMIEEDRFSNNPFRDSASDQPNQENRELLAVLEMKGSTDAVIAFVQDVLDVMRDEIGRTTLIPRTKNHLRMQFIKLKNEFTDYVDVFQTLAFPLIKAADVESEIDSGSRFLRDEEADEEDWVIEWMRGNLSQPNVQTLEALLLRS